MSSDLVLNAQKKSDGDEGMRAWRVVFSRVCTLVALALGGFVGALAFIGLPILGFYIFVGGLCFGLVVAVAVGGIGKALNSWFGAGRGSGGAVPE